MRTTRAAKIMRHATATKPITIIPVFVSVPPEPELAPVLVPVPLPEPEDEPPPDVAQEVVSLYVHAPYVLSPYACAKLIV